ncbi:MAG: alpha-amylase family glycosyl hydrolase [Anaerolineae bacterium]
MEDFVFGTVASDDLKLAHHRAARQGVQHAHQLDPLDPAPGQPVTLTVRIGPDVTAEHVACYYTLDGSAPAGARGVAQNGHVLALERAEVLWDTITWSYHQVWRGALPAQPEGAVVRYRIGAWAGDGPETFADWPNVKDLTDQATAAFFGNVYEVQPGDPARGDTFTFRVDRLTPPDWARAAVIYHIFVDRFYPGDGRRWADTTDTRRWHGGTLWGVADRLDYIADLGATCVWLSPIFPSPSDHGYDATDYDHVAARVGGDEALHALVEAAHARGLRVVLDLVCNHISDQHPYFQAALADPDSPYRGWFTFDSSPAGYRAFFGLHKMPQVNLAHPDARRWMIDIGRYWLRAFDVDGYRLDHANGPGPDFWSDFQAACKAEKPDCFCFGEIVETPDIVRRYVGRLDGCLDFTLADALRRTYGHGRWTEAEFERAVARHLAFFPRDFVMPTFLDNHDMDRFLFIAGGDREKLRRAAAVQMRLPGPPVIYYGTEVGMSQAQGRREARRLEPSRAPMLWGADQDGDLLAYYKALIRARRAGQPT